MAFCLSERSVEKETTWQGGAQQDQLGAARNIQIF